MEVGLKHTMEIVVTDSVTAESFEKGMMPVYSTPHMIQLMEMIVCKSVQPFLEEGHSTVGTMVCVKHLASTKVGEKVRCESELIEIDRKRLLFSVKAYNESVMIGEGTHERFIINEKKFKEKLFG